MPPSARARAGRVGAALGEPARSRVIGGVVGLGLAYAGMQRCSSPWRRRTAASRGDRHRPVVLLFTLGLSIVRRSAVRHASGPQIRDAPRWLMRSRTAAARSSEGTRASSRSQHARRRRGGYGGGIAGRLRPDDSDVPGDAGREARVRPAGRSADTTDLDPAAVIADDRRRAGRHEQICA